uniref:Uncharacterized protein n=1 Tax=Anguilla anguilla TaxID=7936 RepID=A0A0E9PKA7_ANGAN
MALSSRNLSNSSLVTPSLSAGVTSTSADSHLSTSSRVVL